MRAPRPLERNVERRFVERAKPLGCRTRKLNGAGFRDWPDRLVLAPRGVVMLIEFKRPGGRATPKQALLHEQLRALGHDVRVFDDADRALQALLEKLSRP